MENSLIRAKRREFCSFDLLRLPLWSWKAAWLLRFFDQFPADCNRECRSWIREINTLDPVLIRDSFCYRIGALSFSPQQAPSSVESMRRSAHAAFSLSSSSLCVAKNLSVLSFCEQSKEQKTWRLFAAKNVPQSLLGHWRNRFASAAMSHALLSRSHQDAPLCTALSLPPLNMEIKRH